MNIRGPSVCWCGPTTMARWPKSTLLLTVRPRASCAFLAQQAIAGSAAMMFGVSWSSVLIWLETNPTEGKTSLGHARTSAGAETREVIGTRSKAAGRKTSCHQIGSSPPWNLRTNALREEQLWALNICIALVQGIRIGISSAIKSVPSTAASRPLNFPTRGTLNYSTTDPAFVWAEC